MQTREGPLGNCYAACVASILECDLAEVPDVIGDWRGGDVLREWAEARGLAVRFWTTPPNARGYAAGFAVLSAEIRPGRVHAVVAFNGDVVHDPSPRPQWTLAAVPRLWTVFLAVELAAANRAGSALAVHPRMAIRARVGDGGHVAVMPMTSACRIPEAVDGDVGRDAGAGIMDAVRRSDGLACCAPRSLHAAESITAKGSH